MEPEVKVVKPYLSKTILLNAIVGVTGIVAMLGFVPQLDEFVKAQPELLLSVLGAVGIALRLITHGKITLEK